MIIVSLQKNIQYFLLYFIMIICICDITLLHAKTFLTEEDFSAPALQISFLDTQSALTLGKIIGTKQMAQDAVIFQEFDLLRVAEGIMETNIRQYLNQSSDRMRDLDMLLDILQSAQIEIQKQRDRIYMQNEKTKQNKKLLSQQLQQHKITLQSHITKTLAQSIHQSFEKLKSANTLYQAVKLQKKLKMKILEKNKKIENNLTIWIQNIQNNHESYIKGIFISTYSK